MKWQHIRHQTACGNHGDDRHGDDSTRVGEKHFLHHTFLYELLTTNAIP